MPVRAWRASAAASQASQLAVAPQRLACFKEASLAATETIVHCHKSELTHACKLPKAGFPIVFPSSRALAAMHSSRARARPATSRFSWACLRILPTWEVACMACQSSKQCTCVKALSPISPSFACRAQPTYSKHGSRRALLRACPAGLTARA